MVQSYTFEGISKVHTFRKISSIVGRDALIFDLVFNFRTCLLAMVIGDTLTAPIKGIFYLPMRDH